MKLLREIPVETPDSRARISLRHGDLTRLPQEFAVDMLLVSAFPRSYSPVAGEDAQVEAHAQDLHLTCPKCGGAMRVIETFTRGQSPKSRAPPWEDAA